MPSDSLDAVEIDPIDLFWSDGFTDGVVLAHALRWGSYGVGSVARRLLFHVVRDEIMPKLDGDVAVGFQAGAQNPVRAVSADGRFLRPLEAPRTWPLRVSLSAEQVLKCARLHNIDLPPLPLRSLAGAR